MTEQAASQASDCPMGERDVKEDQPKGNAHVVESDEDFRAWFLDAMYAHNAELCARYRTIVRRCADAVVQWRKRYRPDHPALWKRIFSQDRVVKECMEALPVLELVVRYVDRFDDPHHRVLIVDLASGKGYLSMLLSEMLDPAKVEKCVLVDKAWPMHTGAQRIMTFDSSHISWEHIYGVNPKTQRPYAWPIPLQTTKQDLKKSRSIRQLEQKLLHNNDAVRPVDVGVGEPGGVVDTDPASPHREQQKKRQKQEPGEVIPRGPILLLAIHLCGTLSIKAIELFNKRPQQHHNRKIDLLALKPCCLPGKYHLKNKTVFDVGGHIFHAKDVCSYGRWKQNKWHGPPRQSLQIKFDCWAQNLYQGVQVCQPVGSGEREAESGARKDPATKQQEEPAMKQQEISKAPPINVGEDKAMIDVKVQKDGGYQNSFIFAQKNSYGVSVSLADDLTETISSETA